MRCRSKYALLSLIIMILLAGACRKQVVAPPPAAPPPAPPAPARPTVTLQASQTFIQLFLRFVKVQVGFDDELGLSIQFIERMVQSFKTFFQLFDSFIAFKQKHKKQSDEDKKTKKNKMCEGLQVHALR